MPAVDTAPPPSLACPGSCTDHQSAEHPEDEAHWTELDLPLFTALSLDPRVVLSKYLTDAEPTLMLDLTISVDETLGTAQEASEKGFAGNPVVGCWVAHHLSADDLMKSASSIESAPDTIESIAHPVEGHYDQMLRNATGGVQTERR